MQAAKRVSIHIIGDDFGAACADFLSSLEEQSCQDFQLLAVDNASLDGAQLVSDLPNTVVLRNVKKQPFSRCHNQLIDLALARWSDADLKDRFIFVTRPDVILSPKMIERLLEDMEAHPEAGIAVPRLLRARIQLIDDGERREFDLMRDELTRGFAVTRARRIIPVVANAAGDAPAIFAPTPHAFLIRASALQTKSANLDEGLSAVPSVLDLAWRLRQSGALIREVSEATLWLEPYNELVQTPACMRLDTREAAREYAEWRLVQIKNDPLAVRIKHAPWIVGSRLLFWGKGFIRPWLLGAGLHAWPFVDKMRKERRNRSADMLPAAVQQQWFV